MEAFLDRVAGDVYNRLGQSLSDCVFIFPNKRPESYFLKALSNRISSPIEAPKIYSIENFIQAHSGLKPADNLELIFTLFAVYKKLQPDEEFEDFYSWGNLLLKDYDDIDRYMVNAGKLFKNLSAAKTLENVFLNDDDPA